MRRQRFETRGYARLLGGCVAAGLSYSAHGAGFALIEQGVPGLGNAFAGAAAVAEDETTIFFNPAGLTRLSGTRASVAAHLVAPSAKFDDRGSSNSLGALPAPVGTGIPGTSGGDGGEAAVVPNLYLATDITDRIKVGLGINAPFGLETDYSHNWKGRYHALKSELITVNVNPTIAFKATDHISVGFGLNAMYIDAELTNALDVGTICFAVEGPAACGANGLTPLFSDGNQKLTGDDWSFGFNLGLLYEFSDDTRLGIAYRSKVEQELEGDVKISSPDVSFSPTLSALLAHDDVKADVNLPESVSISGYHRVSPKVAILADVTFTKWDRFDEIRVKFDDGRPDSVQPEDWDNSWRYSLGVNYYPQRDWILRAGLARDETAIPSDGRRTPRIPGEDRTWLSLGFSHIPNERFRFDFGYAHLFVSDPNINNVEITTGHRLRGQYDAAVDILSAQLAWMF